MLVYSLYQRTCNSRGTDRIGTSTAQEGRRVKACMRINVWMTGRRVYTKCPPLHMATKTQVMCVMAVSARDLCTTDHRHNPAGMLLHRQS